ncbi:MAG: serine racemase VanT catalytic subunit [Oscillospiraceae bacterium]|nr:serine racemase VanT catalytic subunit [Oscillospiraceae bacterium]
MSRAWAEIDLAALENNVRVLRSMLPEHTRLMPAVKANAYGHDEVLIARKLNALGIDSFCAACAEEGVRLRRGGVRGEILILGYTAPEEFYLLKKYKLSQTVVDQEYAKLLCGKGKFRVHIGVDTGMHRLGIPWDNFDEIAELFLSGNLLIDGIFTHLAADDTAEGKDREFTEIQAARFRQVTGGLNSLGFYPKTHLQSSLGVLNYPELAADYARTGLALYGCVDGEIGKALLPVLSLKARVSSVRTVLRGESIGYGTGFVADRDMKIAALTIGYADGLPRALSDGIGAVLINGKRAPVVGKVCMDQAMVDVSGIDVSQGDTAVVIGVSSDEKITACEIARLCGTIPNEILVGIGERVKRMIRI